MSAKEKVREVIIIGAGLVGPLTGLILQRKGFKVTIYERYGDVRKIPSAGKSINLVLTSRGLRAVKLLGGSLLEDLEKMSVPVLGRMMHQLSGEKNYQPYGKDDSEFNLSISRYLLNVYMINKAEEAGVKIIFDHALVDAHPFLRGAPNDTVLIFQKTDGTRKTVHHRGPVIGADGGGSRLRYLLGTPGLGALHFREELCPQAYKEITFPAGRNGSYNIDKKSLHIWPRGSHFLMALANQDGSFTGTIYIDKKGPGDATFEKLDSPARVKAYFRKYYPTAIPLLGGESAIVEQMLKNPVGLLGTVRTTNYSIGSKFLLIGDAAHAITPFFGQGTNASFEDALVLSQMMARYAPGNTQHEIARAFAAYAEERKPNCDAIATMALENFVEMRDLVGDQGWLLRKAAMNLIENKFEHKFRSRYAMVCYGGGGNITYSAAFRLGKVQWEIVDELCRHISDASQVDLRRAERLIDERLIPLQRELQVDLSKIQHGTDLADEPPVKPASAL